MRRLLEVTGAAALIGATVIAGWPVSAGAAPATVCTGALAPGIYRAIVVPAGATCAVAGPTTVRGGVSVQPGASLIIGPAVVDGGITAANPASVIVHGVTVNDGINIEGGSGPGPEGCQSEDCVYFTAIEDSRVNGGVNVNGYTGFWLGFIRNQVNGGVVLSNNEQLV